jgi:hypothetical protein
MRHGDLLALRNRARAAHPGNQPMIQNGCDPFWFLFQPDAIFQSSCGSVAGESGKIK